MLPDAILRWRSFIGSLAVFICLQLFHLQQQNRNKISDNICKYAYLCAIKIALEREKSDIAYKARFAKQNYDLHTILLMFSILH